jgi:large subunit ribosomal protein L32
MPNPKRKISRTRRDTRRNHYKATAKQFSVDATTGEHHLPHRAFWHEGKLYYKGSVVMEKEVLA